MHYCMPVICTLTRAVLTGEPGLVKSNSLMLSLNVLCFQFVFICFCCCVFSLGCSTFDYQLIDCEDSSPK